MTLYTGTPVVKLSLTSVAGCGEKESIVAGDFQSLLSALPVKYRREVVQTSATKGRAS